MIMNILYILKVLNKHFKLMEPIIMIILMLFNKKYKLNKQEPDVFII